MNRIEWMLRGTFAAALMVAAMNLGISTVSAAAAPVPAPTPVNECDPTGKPIPLPSTCTCTGRCVDGSQSYTCTVGTRNVPNPGSNPPTSTPLCACNC